MKSAWNRLLIAAMAAVSFNAAATGVDVDAYVRKDRFEDIKISPNGEYFAASVPLEDRTILVVLDRATNKMTGRFVLGRNNHVSDFRWTRPDRLLIGTAEKFGDLAQPRYTGELFAIDADGGRAEQLVGYRVFDGGLGTTIKPKKGNDRIWAFPVDTTPADGRTALVSVQPYGSSNPYSSAEQIDVYTGRLQRVASAPIRNARFFVDNGNVVRFALGENSDNTDQLFYRSGNGAEWELLTVESEKGMDYPIGFSEDNKIAYLRSTQPEGPDAIVSLDLTTRERKTIIRDDDSDPAYGEFGEWSPRQIIYKAGTLVPLGVTFMDGKPRTVFLDEKAPEARLHRGLEAAFPGNAVEVTSMTADGRLALVKVYSDRNPGDFYLFDTVAKKASFVVSRRDWFDPDKQAGMEPVTIKARDGLGLHGYLTTPAGSTGKNLPLVVMPHGGPFGIQDVWHFDDDAQMLAQAGYAVLQVNYRGSGGYGRAFQSAGAQEWGRSMQDDLTDATRWAIAQGIADKSRICMYGGSYGGYASLMGVAKEPDLYKCAVGYVGIYDLPKRRNDLKRASAGLDNWSANWMGQSETLAEVSPNRLADRIKVPVLLAAGGEDETAPIEHSKMMEAALRKAGTPVETLYYDNEGHGFYVPAHRREFYAKLLSFLSTHLGGATAAASSAGAATAK